MSFYDEDYFNKKNLSEDHPKGLFLQTHIIVVLGGNGRGI
jgi:hypothetical protein